MLFIAACLNAVSAVAASADPGPAGGAPTPAACASTALETPDVRSAFAAEITEPTVRRLVAAIGHVPTSDQQRIFAMAVDASTNDDERAVATLRATLCPTLDERNGLARALAFVNVLWKPRGFSDDEGIAAFTDVLRTALSAASRGNALTAAQRQTALKPFAQILPTETAPPLRTPRLCVRPRAETSTINSVSPDYVPIDPRLVQIGLVKVHVTLDEHGDVRQAMRLTDTLRGSAGYDHALDAAITAAAASTYTPAIRNCQTIASTYTWVAEFTAEPELVTVP